VKRRIGVEILLISNSSNVDSTVESNYNSKIIYLSKDTDIDNSAKINQIKVNTYPLD
jgi:hypothetical protein